MQDQPPIIDPMANEPMSTGNMMNTGMSASGSLNIQPRNIGIALLLSIVTFGIYGIYWMVKLTDESNSVSSQDKTTSGGLAVILTLVTFGIYGIYWQYKLGKKLYNAGQSYGVAISDNSVIYLILGLFGLGLVSYCIGQSDLNKLAEK